MPAYIGDWDKGVLSPFLWESKVVLYYGVREKTKTAADIFCNRNKYDIWDIGSRGANGAVWICFPAARCTGRRNPFMSFVEYIYLGFLSSLIGLLI